MTIVLKTSENSLQMMTLNRNVVQSLG